MPKMKTNRGAAKRFRITANGKIMRRRANMNHMLEKKPTSRTRRLNRPGLVAPADAREVRKLLGR